MAPIKYDLKNVDPHKLSILDQRIRGDGGITETSFTPPRGVTSVSQHSVSNLTDGGGVVGGGGGNSLAASFEKVTDSSSNGADASNASCQTVHHANFKLGTTTTAATTTTTMTAATTTTSTKKKNTPAKRPVSAIGTTPTNKSRSPINRSRKGDSASTNGQKRMRTKKTEDNKSSEPTNNMTTVDSSIDVISHNDTSPKQPPPTTPADHPTSRSNTDQSSRSESRDTLYSYFGSTNGSASNQATNTNSPSKATNSNSPNPPSSSMRAASMLATPPALQSKASSQKERMGNGNQKTLHFFLGNKKGQRNDEEGRKGDGKSGGSTKEGVNGDNTAMGTSASSMSSAKPPLSTKKKKASLKGSSHSTTSNNINDTTPHSEQSLHEIKRLHTQLSSLQKQLEEANARNNSIKNNQTLISANLQRQLKNQKSEMEQVRCENTTRMTKAVDIMEKFVREESIREAKELRQKLASDGARLGRLVTSRVAGGMGIRSHATMIESWEDGHAPKMLKVRKGELRAKREGLERRREELVTGMALASVGGAVVSNESLQSGDTVNIFADINESVQSGDTLLGNNSESSNANDAGIMMMNEMDRMEANETVRMHLEEVKKMEVELEGEERALNIEKRGHVRALKLVSNEDTSKFRVRRKLHDRYILLNLLGRGGFSEVWRAFDLHSLHPVAVKIHQLESSWSDAKKENYTKHVSREYEIHREVRHPRIVSLFDVFEIDTDSFATVLECCKGVDLDTVLKDKGRLVERDARAILLQILSGMRYLSTPSADGRRQGIIHYDLKPGNILFDEQGNAKITDFGLSKIVDTAEEGDSMELTSQGAGTYWYLPPECFLMDQDVRISNKVDVWSIGVIYFQMLFGRRPFGDGQSQDHILRNQTMLQATEVHFPSKPSMTEEGKAFIRDCLTYDQMSRPSMSQICEHGYLKLTTL